MAIIGNYLLFIIYKEEGWISPLIQGFLTFYKSWGVENHLTWFSPLLMNVTWFTGTICTHFHQYLLQLVSFYDIWCEKSLLYTIMWIIGLAVNAFFKCPELIWKFFCWFTEWKQRKCSSAKGKVSSFIASKMSVCSCFKWCSQLLMFHIVCSQVLFLGLCRIWVPSLFLSRSIKASEELQ